MLTLLVVILILLVLLGRFDNPLNTSSTFYLNGQPITVINILVTVLVIWLLLSIAGPFTPLIGIILVIWLLSMVGGYSLGIFSDLLILIIILYLLFHII